MNTLTTTSTGSNIRRFREKFGFTQEVLAGYLDISREELSYYENDKRNIPNKVLEKAADLFGVNEYELLLEDESIIQTNLAFAFRADELDVHDLKQIGAFKKIVRNYINMKKFMNE